MLKSFLLPLNLQFFAADGTQGGFGGYELSSEQLNGLSLDTDEAAIEPAGEFEGEEFQDNSEEDTTEGEEFTDEEAVGENEPTLFDIPGLGEVDLDTIIKWQSGHMMQSDYTKKTQELAREKQNFASTVEQLKEQMRQEYENQFAPYKRLDELVSQNPMMEQQLLQMLQMADGNAAPQALANPLNHPAMKEMQEKLSQQEQMIQQWQQSQQMQAIQQEWTDIRSKYPDIEGKEQELADFVDNFNETTGSSINLEQGYALMNFNKIQETTKTQTQAEMMKNAMRKRPANTIQPKNNVKESNQKTIPDGDYNSLVDYLMKKDLKF